MNKEERPDKKVVSTMMIFTFILIFAVVLVNAALSPKFTNMFFVPSFSQEEVVAFNDDYSEEESSSVFPLGINSASYGDLQLIPGIGPSTAKLIIDYRNEFGTILDFDELMSIDGIGEGTIELLKEYCIIN